jgi:hypothetical protein
MSKNSTYLPKKQCIVKTSAATLNKSKKRKRFCNYLPARLYLPEKLCILKLLGTALNKSKKRKVLLFLDLCVRHIAHVTSVA